MIHRSKERSDTASLSRSVSEASDFEDAVSEQEEQAMVNLHMQVVFIQYHQYIKFFLR